MGPGDLERWGVLVGLFLVGLVYAACVMIWEARVARKRKDPNQKPKTLLGEVAGADADPGMVGAIRAQIMRERVAELSEGVSPQPLAFSQAGQEVGRLNPVTGRFVPNPGTMRVGVRQAPLSMPEGGPKFSVTQIETLPGGTGLVYVVEAMVNGREYRTALTPEQYEALQENDVTAWDALKNLISGNDGSEPDPTPQVDLVNGVSFGRLRNLAKRWVPGNGRSIGDGSGGMVNMAEVTELAEAVVPLLDRIESEREAASSSRSTTEARTLQEERDDLRRQVKNQARTIEELQVQAREWMANGPPPRNPRAMAGIDQEELNEGGPVTPPNNLHEDMRAALRQLAEKNMPTKAKEINIREVALLVLSIAPLLDEIERLDQIIEDAVTYMPCHNVAHEVLHMAGDLCEDQIGMMGVRLIQALNIGPLMLPRMLHSAESKCPSCAKRTQVVDRWLATGNWLVPGPPPRSLDDDDDETSLPSRRARRDIRPLLVGGPPERRQGQVTPRPRPPFRRPDRNVEKVDETIDEDLDNMPF